MDVPVAIIVFNRPDCTARLLRTLRNVRPKHILVIADGPRADVPTDFDRCSQTRVEIERLIDWDCRLDKNYSDINLGCKRRPETGIDWVFDQVEEAIILEDDCLPSDSFFSFCELLLSKYRHDERVMMISGYCFFDQLGQHAQSYHYSYLASTWGWATWRRAWRLNDPFLSNWAAAIETNLIERLFPEPIHAKFWYDVFSRILEERLSDAWDYQWQLTCWLNNGYRIFPAVSLIKNIGHGKDATHTFAQNIYENELREISFPLIPPGAMVPIRNVERQIMDSFCKAEGYFYSDSNYNSILMRFPMRVKRLINRAIKQLFTILN